MADSADAIEAKPIPAERPKPAVKPRNGSVGAPKEEPNAPIAAPRPKPRPKPAVKPPKPSRPVPSKPPKPSRQASQDGSKAEPAPEAVEDSTAQSADASTTVSKAVDSEPTATATIPDNEDGQIPEACADTPAVSEGEAVGEAIVVGESNDVPTQDINEAPTDVAGDVTEQSRTDNVDNVDNTDVAKPECSQPVDADKPEAADSTTAEDGVVHDVAAEGNVDDNTPTVHGNDSSVDDGSDAANAADDDVPPPLPSRSGRGKLNTKLIVKSRKAGGTMPPRPMRAPPATPGLAQSSQGTGKAPMPLPTEDSNDQNDNDDNDDENDNDVAVTTTTEMGLPAAVDDGAASNGNISDEDVDNYDEADEVLKSPLQAAVADNSNTTYLTPQSGQEEVYAENKRESLATDPVLPARRNTPVSQDGGATQEAKSAAPVVPKPYSKLKLGSGDEDEDKPRGLPGAAEAIAVAKGKGKKKKGRGLFGRRRSSDTGTGLDEEAMQLLTTYDSNSPVVGKALVSQGITRDQAGMLTITPGRSVDIVCMDRPSPKGFWICRNAEGEVGFVSTQYVQLDPSSVRDLLEAIPKPARRTMSEEGLPLDMKGSSLAVTIISPEEFDRQKLERDAKREAQQQEKAAQDNAVAGVEAALPSVAEEESDVFGPPTTETAEPQATYEAVDDAGEALYATADEALLDQQRPATTLQPAEELYAEPEQEEPDVVATPNADISTISPALPPPRLQPKLPEEGEMYAVPTNEQGELYAVPTNEQSDLYEAPTNEPIDPTLTTVAATPADDQEVYAVPTNEPEAEAVSPAGQEQDIYEDMADAHVPVAQDQAVYTEMELQGDVPQARQTTAYEEVTLRVEEESPPVIPPRGASKA
eukprot:m.97083 g.97083  ORF g.97083 m.97083 type:complete len:870 (+) comp15058_c0_seq32:188-2797(+)